MKNRQGSSSFDDTTGPMPGASFASMEETWWNGVEWRQVKSFLMLDSWCMQHVQGSRPCMPFLHKYSRCAGGRCFICQLFLSEDHWLHHIFDWHYFPSDDMSRELKGSLGLHFWKRVGPQLHWAHIQDLPSFEDFLSCGVSKISLMFVVSQLVAGFSPKDLACLTLFRMGENPRIAVEEIQSLRSMGSKRWNNPIESSSLPPIVILTFIERRVTGYLSIPGSWVHSLPYTAFLVLYWPTVTALTSEGTGMPSVRQCTAAGGPWWKILGIGKANKIGLVELRLVASYRIVHDFMTTHEHIWPASYYICFKTCMFIKHETRVEEPFMKL